MDYNESIPRGGVLVKPLGNNALPVQAPHREGKEGRVFLCNLP